ncbi:hypothetical protein GOL82_16225 [Sinorhizobium medicae]|nr:hypothetical protein [Sinorhizobium medicae]
MMDTISKEMQDAYWDEWQQTQDHWLALAAAIKAQPRRAIKNFSTPSPLAAGFWLALCFALVMAGAA